MTIFSGNLNFLCIFLSQAATRLGSANAISVPSFRVPAAKTAGIALIDILTSQLPATNNTPKMGMAPHRPCASHKGKKRINFAQYVFDHIDIILYSGPWLSLAIIGIN